MAKLEVAPIRLWAEYLRLVPAGPPCQCLSRWSTTGSGSGVTVWRPSPSRWAS